MKTYAYVYQGIVWEVISPKTDESGEYIPLEQCYTESFVENCFDITDISPQPEQGWFVTEGKKGLTFKQPEYPE